MAPSLGTGADRSRPEKTNTDGTGSSPASGPPIATSPTGRAQSGSEPDRRVARRATASAGISLPCTEVAGHSQPSPFARMSATRPSYSRIAATQRIFEPLGGQSPR